MTSEYNESIKILAREKVISAAIDTLATRRANATLCRRSYVREVRDKLVAEGSYDAKVAAKLSDETVDRWEGFYDSVTQSRDAQNLKVAYLCGPNPENDLRVFCAAGILPENIWAFESDDAVYGQAVSSALASEFPFIKIVNGSIDTFIEASPMRFDIIYLDFCGPLPSRNKKQKTLLAVSRILARHALNSPGALITNVSLPTEVGDAKGRSLLAKLVAIYLYPKEFLEGEADTTPEGPIAQGYEFDEWLTIVTQDLENYYGQFVTRVLMDHASFISPYNRFPKTSRIFSNFFKKLSDVERKALVESAFHFLQSDENNDISVSQSEQSDSDDFEISGGGDVIVDAGQYPVLWAFAALDRKTNAKDPNYPQWVYADPDFNAFAELFLSQLRVDGQKDELVKNTCELTFSMLAERDAKTLAAPLAGVVNGHYFNHYHQFCDLVLGHQVVELLFRQIAVPYHVNVDKTERWRYQAKDTPMFMDLTILDECRYLYDWMPTIEMFTAGFSDIERQLSYRFALDAVSKHRRWYNSEYFFGTAVIDQYTEPFEARILKPRVEL
ncbi:class I SAM-dependent methyltransferase [Agrobacterium tumefaciens]|uniref:class I SAM-dependent methyltransferase n=1 Tax=Agrobacterium tumefaciens TaxID=358 RepID=UPI001B8A5497